MSNKNTPAWEIRPESSWFSWRLPELWRYRHLLLRIVRRDFLVHHQQTLLGPLWILFQPLITLVTYVLIFDKAVGLSTDGIHPALFYLSGIILWSLFAECFTGTSFTFVQNGDLFGKVYFPRLVIPLATVAVNLARFAIQFVLFTGLLIVLDPGQLTKHPMITLAGLLSVLFIVSGLGMGVGLIFSIITARYRDLVNVIHLVVRLLMFATPVIYPLSIVQPEFRNWVLLNPLSTPVELFRYVFLGQGMATASQLLYSALCALCVVLVGSLLFNKYGNKLQDVI